MLDVHQIWISQLPKGLIYDLIYFMISYLAMSIGIALSNQCLMPIIPTDLFPRELVMIIHKPYANIKISFDLIWSGHHAFEHFPLSRQHSGVRAGNDHNRTGPWKGIAICQRQLSSHLQFQRYIHQSFSADTFCLTKSKKAELRIVVSLFFHDHMHFSIALRLFQSHQADVHLMNDRDIGKNSESKPFSTKLAMTSSSLISKTMCSKVISPVPTVDQSHSVIRS